MAPGVLVRSARDPRRSLQVWAGSIIVLVGIYAAL